MIGLDDFGLQNPRAFHRLEDIDYGLVAIDCDGEFVVLFSFIGFDSVCGRRYLGAQKNVGSLEELVGSEAIGFLDDDGELGGEAFEEGLDVLGWNEIGSDGSEEEGGGGEGCGGC